MAEKLLKELCEIQDMDSLFNNFLLKYYSISYLHYVLLRNISELGKDEILLRSLRNIRNHMSKLICKVSFKDIVSVFHQYIDLKFAVSIELAIITFYLEDYCQIESFYCFGDESDLSTLITIKFI